MGMRGGAKAVHLGWTRMHSSQIVEI